MFGFGSYGFDVVFLESLGFLFRSKYFLNALIFYSKVIFSRVPLKISSRLKTLTIKSSFNALDLT